MSIKRLSHRWGGIFRSSCCHVKLFGHLKWEVELGVGELMSSLWQIGKMGCHFVVARLAGLHTSCVSMFPNCSKWRKIWGRSLLVNATDVFLMSQSTCVNKFHDFWTNEAWLVAVLKLAFSSDCYSAPLWPFGVRLESMIFWHAPLPYCTVS